MQVDQTWAISFNTASPAGNAKEPKTSNYAFSGGWSAGNWRGMARVVFLFRDSLQKGGYIMTGGCRISR